MVLTYIAYTVGYFLMGALIASIMFTVEEADESPKAFLTVLLWPFVFILLPVLFFYMFKYIGKLIKKLPWDTIENKLKKVRL